MVRPDDQRVAGAWASGVASAVAYGLTPTVAVLAYGEGVSPAVLVTLRGLFGAVLIMSFAAVTGRLRDLPQRAALGLTFVCGTISGLQILAYFAAVRSIGAQVAIVLVHIYPIFVLLFVWLATRKRIGMPVIALCASMMSGIALVAGSGSATITATGAGMAMLSAACYAVYLVLGEGWVRQVGAVVAAGLVTVGSTIAIGIIAVATHQDSALSFGGWRAVALQGLFLIPIGVGGAFYAVRRLGSVPMSLIGLLEPIVGVITAAIVLSERLGLLQWAGVAVILASCSLLPWATRWRKRPHSSNHTERPATVPIDNTTRPRTCDPSVEADTELDPAGPL
ncbi:DMT family transporter [Nocardia sp. GAS34]|uniref:DMT family transporter n=1 Tax=unclassified Nocardia TaxID=2637762 RepID=UPI003D1ED468